MNFNENLSLYVVFDEKSFASKNFEMGCPEEGSRDPLASSIKDVHEYLGFLTPPLLPRFCLWKCVQATMAV